MSMRYFIQMSSIVLALALGTGPQRSAGGDGGVSPGHVIELRSAVSRDGLSFRDDGKVIIEGGAAPDLVRLPQGEILLLFDYTPRSSTPSASGLAVARSRDNGRTWSKPEPIRLQGRHADELPAGHGAFLQLDDGRLRLFFISEHSQNTVMRSAVTRDGVNYRLEDDIHVRFPRSGDLHLTAFQIGGLVHLYAAGLDRLPEARKPDRAAAWHCVSRDADRFIRTGPRPTPGFNFVGDVVDMDSYVRAYVSSGDVVPSLVSRNGRDWHREDGARLAGGRNPTVVRLRDRAFLMVYEAIVPRESPPPIEPFGEAPAMPGDFPETAAGMDEAPPLEAEGEQGLTSSMEDAPGKPEIASDAPVVDGDPMVWLADAETDARMDGTLSPPAASADGRAADPVEGTTDSNEPPLLELARDAGDGHHDDDAPADEAYADEHGAGSGSEDPLIADAAADGLPKSDTTQTPPDDGDAEQAMVASAATAEPQNGLLGRPDETATTTEHATARGLAEGTDADSPDVDVPETFDWSDFDPSEFVPPPDFETEIDYNEWYETKLLDDPEDNAYDVYAEFIPGPNDEPGSKPEWPELRDMFNDDDYDGSPGPWDPAEHPEWEQSNTDVQDLLEKFRKAAERDRYAQPPLRSAGDAEFPGGANERLLITLLLPGLRAHRQLVRATLADAWKVGENGRASPQRLLDAWRTALRGATHLTQGVTLIEELVALAERNLVRDNVRWAVKEGVFSTAEEFEAALDLLLTYDRSDPDPTRAIRGEHAASMDLTQYVFKPARPGAPPRVNPKGVEVVLSLMDPSLIDREEVMAGLSAMSAEDIRSAIADIDAYYREMARMVRIGYPEARVADVKELLRQYVLDNAWTRLILPDLGRMHQLRARGIAERRATQLVVAMHLFKARHGRWPGSLDECSAEHRGELRTDPFTGRDFVYRLGDDGPTIYSVSENAVDDGGRHSPRWSDEVEEGESDDFVFWPPQPGRARR